MQVVMAMSPPVLRAETGTDRRAPKAHLFPSADGLQSVARVTRLAVETHKHPRQMRGLANPPPFTNKIGKTHDASQRGRYRPHSLYRHPDRWRHLRQLRR